jgi:hypothetical protein
MPNRKPQTKGITSGTVIIIAQSKSCGVIRHCRQNDSYDGVTLEAGMFLTTYYLSLLRVHQAHGKQDAPNKGHHQWHSHHHGAKQIFCHHCHCLQYDCYHSVTLKAGMFLTTYYLILLRVHQVHAEQDALNKGHHQGHSHHHGAKQIFCHHRHCLQYDCYHSVTLEAGMCLMTYYLSLL